MWHVPGVAQNQLQGVLARWQIQRHFGLTASEVHVMIVGGQTIGQLICTILALAQRGTVKQQMVVSGVFFLGSRWCDTHAAEAKDNRDR